MVSLLTPFENIYFRLPENSLIYYSEFAIIKTLIKQKDIENANHINVFWNYYQNVYW